MFDKKQKSWIKRIHLVTDDGLDDRKAFYKVEIVFVHPLWMMANWLIVKELTSISSGIVRKPYVLQHFHRGTEINWLA